MKSTITLVAVAVMLNGGLHVTPVRIRGAETACPDATVAEALYRRFAALESVVCEIRKTTRYEGRMTRLLSRVYYQRPYRFHVENVAPSQRRILSDGDRIYYYEQGQTRGFSQPVVELAGEWRAAIEDVPATPIEHLAKLAGIPEVALPDGAGGQRRFGYHGPGFFAVLELDASDDRLTGIVFYETKALERIRAVYRYDRFVEVVPGCWIPLRHHGVIHLSEGVAVEETRRITNLSVNVPIDPALFDPAGFFDGVEFADSYRAMRSP